MPHETHRIVAVIIGQNKDHVAWFGAINFDRADIVGNWCYRIHRLGLICEGVFDCQQKSTSQ